MASTDPRDRPGGVIQQSLIKANKLQQSTKDVWRRSANAWYDSKDRCHQTTMETWHRSADTWVGSKNKYRQTASNVLNRYANRIAQPQGRVHQSTSLAKNQSEPNLHDAQIIEPTASPSPATTPISQPSESEQRYPSQPSQSSPVSPEVPLSGGSSSPQSPQSPQSLPSSQSSPSEPDTESAVLRLRSFEKSAKKRKAAEEQIKETLELTDQVVAQVLAAKQLRDTKIKLLGETEHNWIDLAITSATDATRELARLLEPHRMDIGKHKGKLSSTNQKRWKTQDGQRAQEKANRLLSYQNKLQKALSYLESLTATATPVGEAPHPVSRAELPPENHVAEMDSVPVGVITSVAELPSDHIVLEMESRPVVAELPSESSTQQIPMIAELPCESSLITIAPLRPLVKRNSVPKIIVTHSSELSPTEQVESPDIDPGSHELDEIDDLMGWDQAHTDIRLQQSQSLASIVADLENARIQ